MLPVSTRGLHRLNVPNVRRERMLLRSSARCVLPGRGRVLALLTAANVLPVSTRGLPRLNVPNVRRERMLPLVNLCVSLA